MLGTGRSVDVQALLAVQASQLNITIATRLKN